MQRGNRQLRNIVCTSTFWNLLSRIPITFKLTMEETHDQREKTVSLVSKSGLEYADFARLFRKDAARRSISHSTYVISKSRKTTRDSPRSNGRLTNRSGAVPERADSDSNSSDSNSSRRTYVVTNSPAAVGSFQSISSLSSELENTSRACDRCLEYNCSCTTLRCATPDTEMIRHRSCGRNSTCPKATNHTTCCSGRSIGREGHRTQHQYRCENQQSKPKCCRDGCSCCTLTCTHGQYIRKTTSPRDSCQQHFHIGIQNNHPEQSKKIPNCHPESTQNATVIAKNASPRQTIGLETLKDQLKSLSDSHCTTIKTSIAPMGVNSTPDGWLCVARTGLNQLPANDAAFTESSKQRGSCRYNKTSPHESTGSNGRPEVKINQGPGSSTYTTQAIRTPTSAMTRAVVPVVGPRAGPNGLVPQNGSPDSPMASIEKKNPLAFADHCDLQFSYSTGSIENNNVTVISAFASDQTVGTGEIKSKLTRQPRSRVQHIMNHTRDQYALTGDNKNINWATECAHKPNTAKNIHNVGNNMDNTAKITDLAFMKQMLLSGDALGPGVNTPEYTCYPLQMSMYENRGKSVWADTASNWSMKHVEEPLWKDFAQKQEESEVAKPSHLALHSDHSTEPLDLPYLLRAGRNRGLALTESDSSYSESSDGRNCTTDTSIASMKTEQTASRNVMPPKADVYGNRTIAQATNLINTFPWHLLPVNTVQNLVEMNPDDALVFVPPARKEVTKFVDVGNIHSNPVGFRFIPSDTSCLEVEPKYGFLEIGDRQDVRVILKANSEAAYLGELLFQAVEMITPEDGSFATLPLFMQRKLQVLVKPSELRSKLLETYIQSDEKLTQCESDLERLKEKIEDPNENIFWNTVGSQTDAVLKLDKKVSSGDLGTTRKDSRGSMNSADFAKVSHKKRRTTDLEQLLGSDLVRSFHLQRTIAKVQRGVHKGAFAFVSPLRKIAVEPVKDQSYCLEIITITNTHDKLIGYRIDMNSTGCYKISPPVGVLAAEDTCHVAIFLKDPKRNVNRDLLYIKIVELNNPYENLLKWSDKRWDSIPSDQYMACRLCIGIVTEEQRECSKQELYDILISDERQRTDRDSDDGTDVVKLRRQWLLEQHENLDSIKYFFLKIANDSPVPESQCCSKDGLCGPYQQLWNRQNVTNIPTKELAMMANLNCGTQHEHAPHPLLQYGLCIDAEHKRQATGMVKGKIDPGIYSEVLRIQKQTSAKNNIMHRNDFTESVLSDLALIKRKISQDNEKLSSLKSDYAKLLHKVSGVEQNRTSIAGDIQKRISQRTRVGSASVRPNLNQTSIESIAKSGLSKAHALLHRSKMFGSNQSSVVASKTIISRAASPLSISNDSNMFSDIPVRN